MPTCARDWLGSHPNAQAAPSNAARSSRRIKTRFLIVKERRCDPREADGGKPEKKRPVLIIGFAVVQISIAGATLSFGLKTEFLRGCLPALAWTSRNSRENAANGAELVGRTRRQSYCH